MPEQLWFTEILNHLFAGPVTGLLQALHIHPEYPQAPITNAVAMQLLVFLFLVAVFALVRTRLSVDNPGGLQHVFEGAHGFVEGQSQEIIGHHSERYTPFLMTLTFFILISNLLGLIPGFESPTAVPVVPLGCAVCAFVYYQSQGFRQHGIRIPEAFHGPDVVVGDHHDPDRDYQPSGAHAFAHGALVRQYVCRRHGDLGVFLPGADWCSDHFSRASPWSLAAADLYFYPADDGVLVGSGSGGALSSSFEFQVSSVGHLTGNQKLET